jgi:hypothetical protein
MANYELKYKNFAINVIKCACKKPWNILKYIIYYKNEVTMKKNIKRYMISAGVILVIMAAIIGAYASGMFQNSNYNMENTGETTEEKNEETDKENGVSETEEENKVKESETQNNEIESSEEQTTESESSESDRNGLEITQPGETTEFQNNEPEIELKKIKAKAIYLTAGSAGSKAYIDNVINLANTTELNAVVIDVKESGLVKYKSEIPVIVENNLFKVYYNADELLKKLHENNIYVIGRIVCFRDDALARKRADLAVKKPDGSIWKEGKHGAWTNPYNEEVWDYNIEIAKEAMLKGFDEIQFDYVRFPTTKINEVYYGENMPTKVDAICNFLKKAKTEIAQIPVSADIFGIVAESVRDGNVIGQDLERVGMDVDYICPMIYPSHYANSSNGIMGNGYGQMINDVFFEKPDLDPYGVVYNALLKTKERISKVEGYNAEVRTYIQDFTATYLTEGYYQRYGARQVREQIQAIYDAGYEEWILWNGNNNYKTAAFKKID